MSDQLNSKLVSEIIAACDGKNGDKLRQLTSEAAALLRKCSPLDANLFYWNLFQGLKLEWRAWVMGRLAGLLVD